MEKILSKAEMDALLNTTVASEQASGPEDPRKGGDRRKSGRALAVYNFRRPDRVPKTTLNALQLLHDRFCTNVAAALSIYLGAVAEVSIFSVDQTNFGEFLLTLPDPTYLSALSMRPLNGRAALDIGLELVFPIIDRLLGGGGHTPDANRKITDIEKNVIQGVIKVITINLIEAWKPTTEVSFSLQASETRPQLFQIIPSSEVVVVFAFEMKMGETRGNMHLCIPYSALEPISGRFEEETSIQQVASHSDSSRVLRKVLQASFEVTSELPPTMVSVRDLVSIGKDDIIRLDTKIGDRIQLHIGGKPAFQAEPLEMNGHKGAGVICRIEG